jgi:5-methylcytosine-specific restriction endonuclease McrA
MPKKRSPDVRESPFAATWLRDHPDAAKNATRIVRLMARNYVGDSQGFINRNQPMAEYRFAPVENDPLISDVQIDVRQKHATVRFYLRRQLTRGRWRSRILKSATGTDLDAIDFKVDNLGSLDPLSDFISSTLTFPDNRLSNGKQPPSSVRDKIKSRTNVLTTEFDLRAEFESEINKARSMSPAKRKAQLAAAPKKPERMTVTTTAFRRNANVVVDVLERAAGRCEHCKQLAPFAKRADGEPYLEVHHKIPLADDGDDTVENAIALCPNCHRRMHFGIVGDERQ